MIKRHYRCDICEYKWIALVDKRDPHPNACANPACASLEPVRHDVETERAEGEARILAMAEEGRAPGVRTNVSRAVDYTHKMAEEQYGLTDMNDDGRPGTSAFKDAPPPTTAAVNDEIQQMMDVVRQSGAADLIPVAPEIAAYAGSSDPRQAFFGASGSVQGKAPGPQPAPQASIMAAAPSAAVARAQGEDPVALLHAAGKKGLLNDSYEVVGGVKVPEGAQ